MRVGTTAGTLIGAVALMLSGPMAAHAAEGDIVWEDPSGQAHVITNPDNGSCTTLLDNHDHATTADRLVNYTDHKIEVYEETDCGGPSVWTLAEGEEFPEDTAKSIKVWATDDTP